MYEIARLHLLLLAFGMVLAVRVDYALLKRFANAYEERCTDDVERIGGRARH